MKAAAISYNFNKKINQITLLSLGYQNHDVHITKKKKNIL